MTKFHPAIIFLIIINFAFGQKVPLLPPLPKQKTGNTINNTSSMKIYGEQIKENVSWFYGSAFCFGRHKFNVLFKTVEDKIAKLDPSVASEQIISLTKFRIYKNQTDPALPDSQQTKCIRKMKKKNILKP